MKVFIAGATGAIGRPLIAELIRQGHQVTGMAQSETSGQRVRDQGAEAAIADAFDSAAVERALRQSNPDVVIDELTWLPKAQSDMPQYADGDCRLRLEGGGNLHRAAEALGVQRYIQQGSGFFLAPGAGLGDESTPMAVDASPSVAMSARTYTELEQRTFSAGRMEGVFLRYGFFYGPGTWYHPGTATAESLRQQQQPLIGEGQGVWSWIHIEDAAFATVAALSAEPGVYNIVDDDPSPTSVWLPRFAAYVGAPPPPAMSEEEARKIAGEDAVYYATRLRGASNAKAKAKMEFLPRRLEWL